jgi:hypothetical protein
VCMNLPTLEARHYRKLHAWLTIIWLLLGIPTMLWWSESLQWVVWMSLYAIVASHWACFQAARAEDENGGDSGKSTSCGNCRAD